MALSTDSFQLSYLFSYQYTVLDRKDCTLHRAIEVKLPLLRVVSTGQEWILSLVKWVHFFLGPWLLVCQFLEISNQMEPTGEVSNVEPKNLYNAKDLTKNVFIFLRGGFTPAPWTLLVIRAVLLQSLYGVSNPFCPQLYIVAYTLVSRDVLGFFSHW